MAGKDYYATLGVPRTATDKDIKSAFRKLARKYHPDVNPGDKSSEDKFKEINEAYEVLSNTESRGKYDRYGKDWKHADQYDAARRTTSTRGSGPGRTRQQTVSFDFEDAFAGDGVGDIFDRLFRQNGGTGARTGKRTARGQDIEHAVEVTLEEAFAGTTRTVELLSEESCPTCKGTGRAGTKPCSECFAAGTVRRPKRLEVKVPAGVAQGSRVRIAGAGGSGVGGGAKGDLFLNVTIRQHPVFERKGDDLYQDVDVPLVQAVLGGEVTIPTLKSRLALRIPAETQNGRVIRLAGQGMPKLGQTDTRGDMYAKVRVVLPTGLSDAQRQLFEQLKASGL